jgi:hypothetical protein
MHRYNRLLGNIKRRVSATDFAKIKRILGWIAFGHTKRPLKKYEVLNGMALYPGVDVLKSNTKPFANALDLCKPLIEDGPSGAVVFVHSTVRQLVLLNEYLMLYRLQDNNQLTLLSRFLLEDTSGPFLSPITSHYDIAFSCIAHMISSLDFVNPTVSDEELLQRVGYGYFGLHNYANEYWIEHLLSYASDNQGLSSDSADPLCAQISRLAARHNSFLMNSGEYRCQVTQSPFADPDLRLKVLANAADIQDLAMKILVFRRDLQNKQIESGAGMSFVFLIFCSTIHSFANTF